jgi:hypothetical protein
MANVQNCITITIMVINHNPVSYLNHNVSETPERRQRQALPIGPNCVGSTCKRRENPASEMFVLFNKRMNYG